MAAKDCLSPGHRRQLVEGSGIAPEIIAERGYQTITSRADLLDFGKRQRRASANAPALRVPLYSPDGVTTLSQIRPYEPRVPGLKYETPTGAKLIIDVHPRMRERVRHGDEPLLVTEGAKSGDAATSRDVPTVVLAGVWGWCVPKVKPYRLRPCWDHVRLEGREVVVCFDSDCMTKENVQRALAALVAALEARGASVKVVYLPDALDGSKQGVDDFLVAGHPVAELKMLTRRFEPQDFGRIRLSRDEKMRAAVVDLERRFWAEKWKGQGGHSDRDVTLKLIEAAHRHGKVVGDGIRVTLSQGTLAIQAKVSSRTLWKALNRLEERGFCYRDNGGRAPDAAGAFVLTRARVSHYRGKQGTEGKVTPVIQAYSPGDLPLRAPRLKWSSPARRPRCGLVRGTSKVRRGTPSKQRDAVKRLGKTRAAILDALDVAGGASTLQEIADVLHRKRPRDIRRRNLPMLEDAGIVIVCGDTVTLTDNWLEALDGQRKAGGEIDSTVVLRLEDGSERTITCEGAETIARRRLENKRRAYRARHGLPEVDKAPTVGEMDAARVKREQRRKEEGQERPVSPLAAAIHGYLSANPADACQPSGWLGNTLWSRGLYEGRPAVAESKAAIKELGGDAYLRACLERSRTGGAAPPPKTIMQPPPVEDVDVPAEPPPHALDCECGACLYPEPKYAKAYAGSGSRRVGAA